MKYLCRNNKTYYKYGINETRYKAEKFMRAARKHHPELEFIKHKEHIYGKDVYVIYSKRKEVQ